jgi:hypothetical protein
MGLLFLETFKCSWVMAGWDLWKGSAYAGGRMGFCWGPV